MTLGSPNIRKVIALWRRGSVVSHRSFEDIVGDEFEKFRLDVYLAEAIEDASRSFVKKMIKDGLVSVNGGVCTRPGRPMSTGDKVAVEIPPPPPALPDPEDIPLDIVYQDADLVVVNKSSGMVVHPAPGHFTGTLVNAVLFHCKDFQLSGVDMTRPGVVHRIDRYTSGLLVLAKTSRAFAGLSEQVREHSFDRRYLALVRGEFPEDRGRINVPIGRSISDSGRMSVTGIRGRDAVTRFEVLERFGSASHVGLVLETGRTHQIRVHLRYAGRPVLGDPVYGVTDYSAWRGDLSLVAALEGLQGQALHAERLGFIHPATGEKMDFSAPPPPDFMCVLEALRVSARG
jgi:23S rRNA pseudouridine1911/1915/1917 synthase